MCWTVGYVGPREALPLLMGGLRRLEYRGYDSAGVAVQENGALDVLRAEGKLDNLAAIVTTHPTAGHTGIGHTRWATHGRPSEQNAHPHVDCGGVTAVIHNGIIENFEALKAPLIASGHRFTSETDTEVAVHLLEEELAHGRTLDEAALAVLPRLEGAAALAFISAKDPGKIVAARISNAGRGVGRVVFDDNVKMDDAFVRAIPRISFVACGTASYAALVGKYLIERVARIPCDVEIASEYRYRQPAVTKGQLVVAVTQSGETVDTLAAMEGAKKQGARLLSVVSVVGSQASRVSDDVIYLHAGPEISVASTQAYAAMVVDLYLFAIYLGQRRGT